MFTKAKILVIDDELDVLTFVKTLLLEEKYEVATAETAEQALEITERNSFDLVIADINLPGINGLELFKIIKRHSPHVPVIFLSGLSDEFDKVLGLELGAEDYITKPFNLREFKARVKVVLRRNQTTTSMAAPILQHQTPADLTIDIPQRKVEIKQQEVTLTKKEFDILILLASRPGQVFSRDYILNTIWKDDTNVSDRTVDVHIGRLRDKINIIPQSAPYIETVRGVGYRVSTSISIAVIEN